MNITENTEAFEQVLLSYAEMCYSVALALTRNPARAQNLTRKVLLWAWHLRDSVNGRKDVKKRLLIEMRKRFLKDYFCVGANEAVFAQRG